jgi:hypothetical protein
LHVWEPSGPWSVAAPPLASYVAEGPCHHRSHFGSRYLTRADAGTQAFLLAASGVCICRRFSQCGGSISHTQQDHPGTPRTTHPTHKDRNTHTHSHTLAHQLRMSSAVCVAQFGKFFRVLQQSHSFCEALSKLHDSPHHQPHTAGPPRNAQDHPPHTQRQKHAHTLTHPCPPIAHELRSLRRSVRQVF